MAEEKKFDLSPESAAVYERGFVPSLFEQWPPQIADSIGLREGERVLDVACGTGVLACECARRVGPSGAVTGIDITESMLEVARGKRPEVDWIQGDACDVPFSDASFDAVVSQFGMMYFPDKAGAVREMWRVLSPSGRLAVAVWDSFDGNEASALSAEITREHVDKATAETLGTAYALGEEGVLPGIFDEAGVPDYRIERMDGTARFPSLDSYLETKLRGWTLAESLSEATIDAISKDFHKRFVRYVEDDGSVCYPLVALVVYAQKG